MAWLRGRGGAPPAPPQPGARGTPAGRIGAGPEDQATPPAALSSRRVRNAHPTAGPAPEVPARLEPQEDQGGHFGGEGRDRLVCCLLLALG